MGTPRLSCQLFTVKSKEEAFMAYNLTIKKNSGGEWVVEPVDGARMVTPGENVVWHIDPKDPATAHLQFLEDLFEPSGQLDKHWVSEIKESGGLELTVSSKALPDPNVRRRTYRYAVAVVDSDGMHYAIGNNPPPDLEAWRAIGPLGARAAHAFAELYAWFGERGEELYPIYRDEMSMPESARAATAALADAFAAAIVSPGEGPDAQAAVARHLVDFWTWRSLVVERGLAVEAAAEAAVAMLLAVGTGGETAGG